MTAKPIPDWATKAADALFFGPDLKRVDPLPRKDSDIHVLARLLVSTREAALREAAALAKYEGYEAGGRDMVDAEHILSLIDRSPS